MNTPEWPISGKEQAQRDANEQAAKRMNRLSDTPAQSSEVRPGVGGAVESNAADEKVLRLTEDAELFRSQMQKALGIVEDGRVWFGTGLLARAETLVEREAERKGLASRVEELEGEINWWRRTMAAIHSWAELGMPGPYEPEPTNKILSNIREIAERALAGKKPADG